MKGFLKGMLALVLAAVCLAGCGREEGSDSAYVKEKGSLVMGMTEYAPMAFRDESGQWTGFDVELGRLVAEKLGVELELQVLPEWSQKFAELDSRHIDVIWNGLTITDEVLQNTSCTDPYLQNAQVVVMKRDALSGCPDAESLKGRRLAVENGSAGQEALDALGIREEYVALQDQQAAILEVKAGTSDACVVDLTMAKAMTGDGSDFSDLAMGPSLTEEQYGIAFRKGSDLTQQVNEILQQMKADGTLQALADKYNLTVVK